MGLSHLLLAGGVLATESLEGEQEQIQQEREAVQSDLSDAEVSLVELVQNLDKLNEDLSDLNDAIVKNEEMIVETEEKIAENETEVEELELEIERLQNDIDQRFELLKDRASTYQRQGSGNSSYIEVILGAENFGDFVSRLVTISKIAQADNDFIEQLEINSLELEDVQEEYVEILLELEDQVRELEVLQADIENQREETNQVRDEVKDNEKEQKILIEQLIEEDKGLASKESDIRERIQEEVRRQEVARQAEIEAQAKAEEEKVTRQAEKKAQAKAEEEAVARQSEKEAKEKAASNASQGGSNESGSSSTNSPSSSEGLTSRGSGNSSTSEEGSWQTFSATAYTASCTGCSGVTRTGIDLKANPNAKVIAVDPSVIPLGSRVEVKGYGTFLAADTGGAINGRKIDIFMSDRSDAVSFGRRSVQVRVIN